jgi:hypothetical protein
MGLKRDNCALTRTVFDLMVNQVRCQLDKNASPLIKNEFIITITQQGFTRGKRKTEIST